MMLPLCTLGEDEEHQNSYSLIKKYFSLIWTNYAADEKDLFLSTQQWINYNLLYYIV